MSVKRVVGLSKLSHGLIIERPTTVYSYRFLSAPMVAPEETLAEIDTGTSIFVGPCVGKATISRLDHSRWFLP